MRAIWLRRLTIGVVLATVAGCSSSSTSSTTARSARPITTAPTTTDAPAASGSASASTTAATDPPALDPTASTSAPPITAALIPTPNVAKATWKKCDDPKVTSDKLQCASVAVPLDYANLRGPMIDLAVVRVKATKSRAGAVLFNPGGPGGSGFDFVAGEGERIVDRMGLATFDLVGFDPRGVQRSNGIRCVTDAQRDANLYLDDTPNTPQAQAALDAADAQFVDGCTAKYGDTLRAYSTENTARDIDVIRKALGDDQISYLGISYGTYLGATYATMFPDRVRAMVLDSAEEPHGDSIEEQYVTQLVGFEGAFDNWAAWCQHETTCGFHEANVAARWDALLQRLDDAPLTSVDGRPGNQVTMERATIASLYSKSQWPVLGAALAKADAGDPQAILALADEYNGRHPDGTFDTLFQSFTVINCASGLAPQMPADPAALVATIKAKAPRFGRSTTVADFGPARDDCGRLTGHVQPIGISFSAGAPIVVVGGTNDPATPIRWAKKMVGELGSSARLVTFTGEGHGQLLVSSCVTDIEAAVLADAKTPDGNPTCAPDPTVDRPSWWDSIPIPAGVSAAPDLAFLLGAIGIDDTTGYGEVRTTTVAFDKAAKAYQAALTKAKFTIAGTRDIQVTDSGDTVYHAPNGDLLDVFTFGPKAFDDPRLASLKSQVPADTTLVVLAYVPSR